MQVLNKQERTTAFLWFLLFFVVTVGLFVLAVFFNYQVPVRENTELRKELGTFRKEETFQASFMQNLEKVKANLDSINMPNQNAIYMDQEIAKRLSDMHNAIPKDVVNHYGLYDNSVQIGLALHQSKQQLRGLQDAQKTIAELKEKVQDLTSQLNQSQSQLDYYRRLSASTPGR
jgi:DNA repair ATPase RecN